MRIIYATVVVLLISIDDGWARQAVSEAEVQAAITAGLANKYDQLISSCVPTASMGRRRPGTAQGIELDVYSVVVSRNAGRIAAIAADAKRVDQPFEIGDIEHDLRTPAVFVSVEPKEGTRVRNATSFAALIERVMLKSTNKPDTVAQPIRVDMEPTTWKNARGGTIEANRAVAFFDPATVRGLTTGDLVVVIVTTHGERRCTIATKDRSRLQF